MAIKAMESIVDSINNNEHNDVIIKLDDGDIYASKLILSTRSEYFRAMFSKQNQCKETINNLVKFDTKKLIMKPIIQYIYSGILDIEHLKLSEGIELLKNLRLFLIIDGVNETEELIKYKLQKRIFSIKECFQTIEVVNELKFEKTKLHILSNFATSLDLLLDNHKKYVKNMSLKIIEDLLTHIQSIETKNILPFSPNFQIKKFKLCLIWIEKNNNSITKEKKRNILNHIVLEKFTIKQLFGIIKESNLFDIEEIIKAAQRNVILYTIIRYDENITK